jgi:predicted ATPase/GAF domain-containing protein
MIPNTQVLHEGRNFRVCLTQNNEIVKVIRASASNYKAALAYLQNEYDLSNDLNTSSVRKALRMGSFEQYPALFLEYVTGVPLKNSTKKYSTLGILNIALKVVEGIQVLHQNNIIHKDLSPNNIIIDANDDITLIDLGISSKVSQKQHHLGNPIHLEGTLKYISPEQTGRVNKVVDYRSDLYSLGVILYELFVDRTPFDFDDPIELVHAHIATMPIEIHRIKSTIPIVISDIISKLLSKNAENRYQTALGLKHDLEICLEQLEKNHAIKNFELGQKDRSGVLRLPQKLYGREDEIDSLLQAFERVSQGSKELLVVGGYSGVGKSALVNEVHKSISEKRAYFITGKYEQYQRTIPYFALRKAFAELISYWLLEDKNVLEKWKKRIESTLGDLAQVVTEIIPELELLIGTPADVPKLEAEQYANRFNYVFGLFMNAICTSEHPLVIFIDDWQWVDSASLGLFKFLLADEQLKNVLFIAAYRDNEVDESHLFVQTLASIKESKVTPVTELTLKNLSSTNIHAWIEDALKQTNIDELVKLIFAKTQGNAFFTAQFLGTLFDEGLLKFDFETNLWKWDIEQIQSQNITDNVVVLMTNKVKKLSAQTQEMLELGACVGASFKLSLLATISEQTEEVCYKILEEALLAGLILKINQNTYHFVHDRIQQATYGLLTEQKQKELHFAIGKIWLKTASESEKEDKLMNIISQLNFGLDLIESPKEKAILLSLNIQAGKKAQSSIAYTSACHHFEIAEKLAPVDAWTKHYEQTFELYKDWAEVAFLANEKEKSEKLFDTALGKAQNKFDKAIIHAIKIRQKAGEGKYLEASDEGILALNLFDYNLPAISDQEFYTQEGNKEIGGYLQIIQGKVPLTSIPDLPILSDKGHLMCIQVISMMLDAVFLGAPYAYLYVLVKAVNTSLQHGKSGYFPFLLTNMGIIHASMKDYKSTYLIATLALEMRNKLGFTEVDARFHHLLGYNVLATQEFKNSVENQLKAHQIGLEVGDLAYGGYGLLVAGRHKNPMSLVGMLDHTNSAESFFKRSNNHIMLLANDAMKGYVLNLQGKSLDNSTFSYQGFEEGKFVETFTAAAPTWIAIYKRFKIQSLVTWGFYEEAYVLVQEREQWLALMGAIDVEWKSAYYVFTTITVLKSYKQQKIEREVATVLIKEAVDELHILYQNNPKTIGAMYHIVLAQQAEFENDVLKVMDYYDVAIKSALSAELLLYVATANELATEFYISINKDEFAGLYLKQAINYYQLWGSDAKAQALEVKHKYIYRRAIQNHGKATVHTLLRTQYASSQSTKSSILDVETLLKASQTLSKEIHLERLVQRMLRILIENAGADKGFLFLNQKNDLYLQGEIHADGNEKMLQNIPLREARKSVPIRVINYVVNSENILVSDDATQDVRFSESIYIKENAIKSLLCLPITNKSKFIGLLYLENSLVEGAFSQDRVDLLSALASQIAISIENALLYENLENKVEERTAQLQEKNIVLAEQNHIIDSAHKKIRASITYAERIQQAILPQADRIKAVLPKSFVYFKPRDVVSGDFYWCSVVRDSQGNQKVIFATADCTGHGVPGAFMSMVGANLLTQIVNDKRMHNPGLILDLLHGGVKHLLQQDKNKNRDGMDISISSVDWNTKTLEYAGAKRPLYYVQDGEMKEIKGDVYPIGGLQRGINRRFTTQKVSFAESPIMAYTFSDGYPDQFGGEKTQKFMTKRFRNMLSDIADKSMEEQKEYLGGTFDDWKGTQRQIDDILVVGMRLE